MSTADHDAPSGLGPVQIPAQHQRAAADAPRAATGLERPVGYAALLERYGIDDYRPAHLSYLHGKDFGKATREDIDQGRRVREIFPGRTSAGESDVDHLTFAMRHDGVDLELLRRLCPRLDAAALTAAISAAPTSGYLRQVWFLHEWITGQTLPIPGIESKRVAAVPILDPDAQITRDQGLSRRHGVRNNLLGTASWCPQIRRSPAVENALSTAPLALRDRISAEISHDEARRINQFLVTEETWATFAIEGERPQPDRSTRFYDMLERATARPAPALTREFLDGMQRDLMERPTFKDGAYRGEQVWIGHRSNDLSGVRARVSYIAPQFADVPELMEAFIPTANDLVAATSQGTLHPVVTATAVSSGFVYIHPYVDGNGRISRLLMQHALAAGQRTTNERLLIPISAAIERDRQRYYDTLNRVSTTVMCGMSYEVDGRGQVSVNGATKDRYRYPDLTDMTAYLGEKLAQAVEKDLVAERITLQAFDRAEPDLRRISQLGDKDIDLFFRMVTQNKGSLSARKRDRFGNLRDDQISAMEEAIRKAQRS